MRVVVRSHKWSTSRTSISDGDVRSLPVRFRLKSLVEMQERITQLGMES
jgi:hypothetical protein